MAAERLMLLDTASLYFRAFFGVPDTTKGVDGTPTNAIRGMLDFIAPLVDNHPPTHLVACWDEGWRPTWRVTTILPRGSSGRRCGVRSGSRIPFR